MLIGLGVLRARALVLFTVVSVVTACTGEIVVPYNQRALCGQAPRLSRLTGTQYRAVVSQALPKWEGAKTLNVPFTQPRRTDLYSTWSAQGSISEYEVDELWNTAETVATAWQASKPKICAPMERTATCLHQEFDSLFSALRSRLPTDDEVVALGQAVTDAETELSASAALQAVVRSLLMDPAFLFRSEIGVDGRLTSAEVAAALSFTLHDRPPDQQLQALVATDGLTDPAVITREASRLLDGGTEVPALRRFLHELFKYDGAAEVKKDAKLYPFHRPAELVADTERVVEKLVSDHARSGLLKALLTSDLIYVRPSTAKSWGVTLEADAGVFLHDRSRAGVLTHPSWLVSLSHTDHNHLVRRGAFIRERLLCGIVPSLPAGGVPALDRSPGKTLRQSFEEHSSNGRCVGCHRVMDPLAHGLEAWDHLGRPQLTDNGGTVVTSSELSGAGEGFDGQYTDARDMMERLAASPNVKACWVKQVFRFVRGREVVDSDSCELERLTKLYDDSNEDTLALIEALFASPEFLERKSEPTP